MNDVGRMILRLNSKIRREFMKMPSIKKLDNISSTNGFIIVYIYEHGGSVCQREIEERFGITRSTVSKVITLMEQKGLIIREEDLTDSRKKKVSLTDKAIELSKEFVKERDEFEDGINKALGNNLESFRKSLEVLDMYFSGGEK